MNFRITTLSLLIAATCGVVCNQAAKAEEGEERRIPSMRFEFEPNTYRLDSGNSRRHAVYSAPEISSVRSGAAPSNLLGIPKFIGAPAAPAAPVVAALPQVSAKISSSSPWAALFNHPSAPLIAQGAGMLPLTYPQIKAAHMTASKVHASHGPSSFKPHHAPTVASKSKSAAPIASYDGKFYSQGAVVPGYNNNGGSVVDTSLSGKIMHKH